MNVRSAISLLWKLLILGLIAAFVIFVWPTRYRYDHINFESATYPVRIDRVNGNADMLVPDEGWVPVEGTQDSVGTQDDKTTAAGSHV